jgi:hypothetical protein
MPLCAWATKLIRTLSPNNGRLFIVLEVARIGLIMAKVEE